MPAGFEDSGSRRGEINPEATLAALADALSDGHGNINRVSACLTQRGHEVAYANNGLVPRVLRAAGVKTPHAKVSTSNPVQPSMARAVGADGTAAILEHFERQPDSDQPSRVELTVYKSQTPHEGHHGAHTRAGLTLILDEYRLRLTRYRPSAVAGHEEVTHFVDFAQDGSFRSHDYTDRAGMSHTGSAMEAAASDAVVMAAQLGFDLPDSLLG